MEKEYIKPEFRVVSLISESNIAAGGSTVPNEPEPEEDRDQNFLPWVPIN